MANPVALQSPNAQGPGSLNSPIPNAQPLPSLAGLSTGPTPTPPAAPAATPPVAAATAAAPAQSASAPDVGSFLDTGSFLDQPEQPQGPPKTPFEQLDDKFAGRKVEGTFPGFGLKMKVDEKGAVDVYNSRTKTWGPAPDALKQFAKHWYSAAENAPAQLTGMLVNGVLPGGGGVPGAIARTAAVGAGAYAAQESGLGESAIINKISTPENMYILRKLANPGDSTSPAISAVEQMGAQAIGETFGHIAGEKKKISLQEADNMAFNRVGLEQALPLEGQAEKAGIPIYGTQTAAQVPGMSPIAQQERDALSGKLGPEIQRQMQLRNQAQINQIADTINNMATKVAPGIDFDNMSINQLSRFSDENFMHKVNANMRASRAMDRVDVEQHLRDTKVDVSPIVSAFESELANKRGFYKDLINKDGSVDIQTLMKMGKSEGYSDRSISKMISSYKALKEATIYDRNQLGNTTFGDVRATPVTNRDVTGSVPGLVSPGENFSVHQRGVFTPEAELFIPTGPSGKAEGGMTFKNLSQYVDHLQQIAYEKDDGEMSGSLKKIAAQATMHEDDVLAEAMQRAGRPDRAAQIIKGKDDYASIIDSTNKMASAIKSNPDAVAETMFGQNSQTLSKSLSVMSDTQKKEVAGSLLRNSAYKVISMNPGTSLVAGIDAKAMEQQFFGSPSARQKTEMIFGQNAPDIESLINIAKVAQQNVPRAGSSQESGTMQKVIDTLAKLSPKGHLLNKTYMVVRNMLPFPEPTKDVLDARVSGLINMMENQEVKMRSENAYASPLKAKLLKSALQLLPAVPNAASTVGTGGRVLMEKQ